MKILLVGEYSRLHNSLKEGLQALGHEVILVSTGDHFKKFPSDILLKRRFNSGITKKFKVGIYKIFGIDITSIVLKKQFFSHKEKFKNFDVVQLINESPFSIAANEEKEIISFLRKHNKKLFLLSCGADYSSIKFAFEKKLRYSIFNPLFDGKVSEKDFAPALKYLNPDFKALHNFIFKKMDGVIASDLDYHIPLKGQEKYRGLIPNPINTSLLEQPPFSIDEKIIIFHGINRVNYFKKGNDYFEAALSKIEKKYASKVEIITVESLPYSEYISAYNSAHILLDQVFSYDQGYNALEAMAKGKVVFTGAETEFLECYNLKENEVCINALPDLEYLFQKLEELILNPKQLIEISNNARKFIEREHNYISVAEKYLETWKL
ncbi:glycosyltransferase family protein [Aequorivita viscosa]|uniref:Glycosyl transferases group 1 n=1 Tax=Aequorivita viscosa TaxID=797419 RepID=A0A1M6AXI8_9FLAO|nr:glycosyltransferase [Aequorivita viscosa]SDW31083.1 Glycosyl transferases group 1 [Aequorivita viscosa]SHI41160.1 Glycosyl transferases group 1 [Aequorivita viscosa]